MADFLSRKHKMKKKQCKMNMADFFNKKVWNEKRYNVKTNMADISSFWKQNKERMNRKGKINFKMVDFVSN